MNCRREFSGIPQLRCLGPREEPCLEQIRTGLNRSSDHLRRDVDHDPMFRTRNNDLRNVLNATNLDTQAGFLLEFTNCSIGVTFEKADPTAWNDPLSKHWLFSATAKQYPSVLYGDYRATDPNLIHRQRSEVGVADRSHFTMK